MAKSDVAWKAPSDGTAVATELLARIEEAARAIQSRSALRPEVGIVLGTGLGELAGLETEAMVPYGEIPGFPVSTVETHAGELHLGVPDTRRVRAYPLERELRVAIVVRAREDDDGDARPRLGHPFSWSSIS